MKSKPKIFISWTLNSGVTFYRFINFIKYMRRDYWFGYSKWKPDFQGVADWEYNIKDPKVANDIGFLMENCDMVIASKFHSNGGLKVMHGIKDLYPKKPFFTEIDDNVFAVGKHHQAFESYNPGSEAELITKHQIENSTGLIVSTENLRTVMEDYNPNVWVIPNAIDFEVWDNLKDKKRTSKKIRIGWAGGGSHITDLEMIVPTVKNILQKFKNVEFCFLGGVIPELKNLDRVEAHYKWYPIDKYPQALKDLNLDIAIAPLKDSLFNRAKSNLRWLEYSALMIPTVCSNVEPFKCIRNKKDGFIVSADNDEMEDTLAELITNESLRKQVGRNAYERVKKDYNAEIVAKLYCKTIKHILMGNQNISDRAKVNFMASTGIGL